jgi:hypothetical protein
MTIPLLCPCGKRLQVGDDKAGGRARCPSCKRILDVDECREQEPYRFEDEAPKERQSRIVSRDSDEAVDDVVDEDEGEETEEVEEVRKKPSSWVPAYCYNCDESMNCKRIVFWSAKFGSRDTSYQGNMIITRTTYRNIQQHQIFLCRECATEQWKKVFTTRLVWSLISEGALILFFIALIISVPKDATVAILLAMLLFSGIPLAFFILFMMKLRKPTFGKSIMEPIAIRLARREISKHTKADTFFTSKTIKALSIR